MLKVKALALHTKISHYVIPGMERLLQNSPDLEKLTVRARNFNTLLVYSIILFFLYSIIHHQPLFLATIELKYTQQLILYIFFYCTGEAS